MLVNIVNIVYTIFLPLFCSLLALAFLWVVYCEVDRKVRKLPPGPIPLPFLGHLHLLGSDPVKNVWEMSKKYGPYMYLRLGQTDGIVVSDPTAVKNLFVGKGRLVNARYINDVLEISSRGGKGTTGHGENWKRIRDVIHTSVFAKDILGDSSLPVIVDEFKSLIAYWKNNPSMSHEIVQQTMASTLNVVSTLSFSKRLTSLGNDEFHEDVSHILKAVSQLFEALSFTHLQSFIPILGKIKENPALPIVRHSRDTFEKYQLKIYEEHLATLDTHHPRDMVDRMIVNGGIAREDIIQVIYEFITAGTHTVSVTSCWMVHALNKFPEVKDKLKEEILRVISSEEDITMDSLQSIQYLNSFIREVQRYFPLSLFGMPHKALETFTVDGYTVPKDSMVMFNIHRLSLDPEIWGDPDVFRPERFMGEIDSNQKYALAPFGIGARKCPAESLAMLELQTFMVLLMLSNLEMLPEKLEPEKQMTLVIQPKEMPIMFMPGN